MREREKEKGREKRKDGHMEKKPIIFVTCVQKRFGNPFPTQKKQMREETHSFNTVVKFENMQNLGRNSKRQRARHTLHGGHFTLALEITA